MSLDAKKKKLLSRLRQDARKVSRAFNITYKKVKEGVDPKFSGQCYEDGIITIRLVGIKSTKFLSYRGLQRTLCHELAHAALYRNWTHHSKLHKAIEDALFVWLRHRKR